MPNSKTKSGFLLNIENWFRYRRFPYPKRSVEFVALIAVSCTFFLFMHTKNLNSKLHEMETKLQPSELSALGLSGGNSIINDNAKHHDLKGLHSTYQYLKSTGQLSSINTWNLNNTFIGEYNQIYYNRVPKTGSSNMIFLMRTICEINDFKVKNFNTKIKKYMDIKMEEEHAIAVNEAGENIVIVEHSNYLDFNNFNLKRPIYINTVREPLERAISWFYYLRSPWIFLNQFRKHNRPIPPQDFMRKDFQDCVLSGDVECSTIQGSIENGNDEFRQTLYFCGHNKTECMPLNEVGPMQIAKRRVEEEYAVVGTWEETNITLTVLEHYIPRYFRGALDLYNSELKDVNKNSNPYKPTISQEVRDLIAANLTREIEFYEFCKQRLYKQYIAIKKDELALLFDDDDYYYNN